MACLGVREREIEKVDRERDRERARAGLIVIFSLFFVIDFYF